MAWDLDAGSAAKPKTLPAVPHTARLSPDGLHLATTNLSRANEPEQGLRYELRILDVRTGEVVRVMPWPAKLGVEAATAPSGLDNTLLAYSPRARRVRRACSAPVGNCTPTRITPSRMRSRLRIDWRTD
jgi:hypothetical protein